MSKKVDKLLDQRFRRTADCLKYFSVVRDRGVHVPLWDDEVKSGRTIDLDYVKRHGLETPIVIGDGLQTLGLRIPDASLSELAAIVGADTPVKVIDVGNQEEMDDWTIGEYARYMEGKTREHKILNLISLEISASPLALRVLGPGLVRRQLDWVDGGLWPEQRRTRAEASSFSSYPRVQRYLLVSSGGAYTDFHVDLGGTSVWYHIVRGEKVFYFIRPSARNLAIYEAWSSSPDQNSIFLPDLIAARAQENGSDLCLGPGAEGEAGRSHQSHPLVGECFQVHMKAGDTMYLPGGWIHAVYTPKDSVVFGGNFLHFASIGRQLEVFGIENRSRVSKKYRYPYFKQMSWYAITSMLPLARASSQSFDGDEDAELKNDALYEMYSVLIQPRMLYQWPYLLRACELWLQEGAMDDEDKAVFEDGAKAVGCATPADVLAEWWELLAERAAEEEREGKRKEAGEFQSQQGVSYSSLTEVVCRVRNNLSDVVGDELVVRRLTTDSEKFLYRIQFEPFLDKVACPKSEVPEVPFTMPRVEPPPANAKAEVAQVEPTPVASQPKLTLKVRRNIAPGSTTKGEASAASSSDEEEEIMDAEDHQEETEPSEGKNAKKKLKLRISTRVTDGDDDKIRGLNAVSTPPDAVVTAESKESAPTSPVRKHVPRLNLRVSVAAADVGSDALAKDPVIPPRKSSNVEVVAEETIGRQRFGTRGIKLSAKFLENAADYFDGELEGGGDRGKLTTGFAFDATDGRADDHDFDEGAPGDEDGDGGGIDDWSDGENEADDDEYVSSDDEQPRAVRKKRGRGGERQLPPRGGTSKKAKPSTADHRTSQPVVPLHMASGSLIPPFRPIAAKPAAKSSKVTAPKTAASVRQDLLKRLGSKFR